MAALPLSPRIARKSVAFAERYASPTHAADPHSNAVFAPRPLSRQPPPEREVRIYPGARLECVRRSLLALGLAGLIHRLRRG